MFSTDLADPRLCPQSRLSSPPWPQTPSVSPMPLQRPLNHTSMLWCYPYCVYCVSSICFSLFSTHISTHTSPNIAWFLEQQGILTNTLATNIELSSNIAQDPTADTRLAASKAALHKYFTDFHEYALRLALVSRRARDVVQHSISTAGPNDQSDPTSTEHIANIKTQTELDLAVSFSDSLSLTFVFRITVLKLELYEIIIIELQRHQRLRYSFPVRKFLFYVIEYVPF